MEFIVNFKRSEEREGFSFEMDSMDGGLKLLDEIRKEAEVKALKPEVVDPHIGPKYFNPCIVLSEEQARETGLFEDCHKVEVWTEGSLLNQFAVKKLDFYRESETGEILRASWRWDVDAKAAIAHWKAAGYPTRWEFEGEDKDGN